MTDALSTGCFGLGTQASLETLQRVPGPDVLFIPDRVPIELHIARGMARMLAALPDVSPAVRIPVVDPRH